MQQTTTITISPQNITEAFRVLSNPTNSPETISAANEYLNECQKSPKFALMLIQLYSSSGESFVQLQSILLLLNIIKRNWQVKRGRGRGEEENGFESEKPTIRKELIAIYPLHNLAYVKHINQALRFLARQDYPAKYLQLQQFMLSSLKTLYSSVLTSQQSIKQQSTLIIGFLSTVKIITKQYASKRLTHSQSSFNIYISQLIKAALPISQRCHQMIAKMWELPQIDTKLMEVLIQSAKKIDKIVLYCLLCMPGSLQYVEEVRQMFRMSLNSVAVMDAFKGQQKHPQLNSIIESYITGVLQQVFKTQSLYPFLLVNMLQNYLHMILKMLIQNIPQKQYKSERLILTILQANLKIFTCFTYYMNSQQFQSSIYNRKQSNNLQLQQQLHGEFLKVFTQENVTQVLEKMITEVMVARGVNLQQKDVVDQEMVLQETEVGAQDQLAESTAYEVSILLCKNILKCFRKQLKPVLQGLFLSVGSYSTNSASIKQKVIQNTMQLILVLPIIYQQQQLPLQHVMNLLQVLYTSNQYSMLARLIKNYHEYLNHTTLQNSFSILSQIVSTPITSPHITIDIIYQAALTMKKILTQHESDIFSFQNFSSCIVNLLQLLQNQKFSSNPTLMWPLIKLANQLLKLTNTNVVIEQVGENIIDCMYPLIEVKGLEELTVCGIAQTLMELLNIICSCFRSSYLSQQPSTIIVTKSTVKILYACYSLISNNLNNTNMQNVDSLYLLWLCLIRNYPTLQQQQASNLAVVPQMLELNQNMQQLFSHLFDTVLEEDNICAVQVLQEYLICGLMHMNQQQLLGVFEKLLNNCLEEHKVRTYTALFSMYYCYLLVNQSESLQPDILKLLLNTLIRYVNEISPQINGLRTLIMIIVNFCVIKFGVKNIYELFSSWQLPALVQGIFLEQSVCLKSALSVQFFVIKCSKINATAYLKALQELGAPVFGKMLQTPIEENYPLDTVLKTMVISLDSIKISQGWTTFSNMYKLILPTENTASTINSLTSRKIKLQLSGLVKEILISDQRQTYQKLMTELLTFWDWAEDDIMERFDKITSNEIIMLIKGTYKKEYDINEPD